MGLDRAGIDQHLLDAEAGKLRLIDIIFIIQRHADLVYDLIAPLLLDIGSYQPSFVPVYIVLTQDLLDGLDAGLNGGLVAGGAVLPQEVFQNIGRNNRVALDGLDEILTDDKPWKKSSTNALI